MQLAAVGAGLLLLGCFKRGIAGHPGSTGNFEQDEPFPSVAEWTRLGDAQRPTKAAWPIDTAGRSNSRDLP